MWDAFEVLERTSGCQVIPLYQRHVEVAHVTSRGSGRQSYLAWGFGERTLGSFIWCNADACQWRGSWNDIPWTDLTKRHTAFQASCTNFVPINFWLKACEGCSFFLMRDAFVVVEPVWVVEPWLLGVLVLVCHQDCFAYPHGDEWQRGWGAPRLCLHFWMLLAVHWMSFFPRSIFWQVFPQEVVSQC